MFLHSPGSKLCAETLSRAALVLLLLLLGVAAGCSRAPRETNVASGNRLGILHLGNGAEPADLDPQVITGTKEFSLCEALFEGLVNVDPVDLHPIPGVAERWEISPDGRTYTFHLRPDAKWSDGARVTAADFAWSWQRMLTPAFGAEFAFYYYPIRNAGKFNHGEITDFAQVGVRTLDESTLEVSLENPTPYFLNVLARAPCYPVPRAAVEKFGPMTQRGTAWTRAGNLVGNGPFTLKEWRVNEFIAVEKNPAYWDAARVQLNAIRFYPMDNLEVEERAFRAGQLHKTFGVPFGKLDAYRKNEPGVLRIDPLARTQYLMFNCERAPVNDPRVRRALGLCIDRESLVRNVTRGGEGAAHAFTTPGLGGYTARARLPYDPEEGRRLLAEAGFPGGKGFPPLDLLIYTTETYRVLAEAVQQMWRKELGIEVGLANQEWKVYLASRTAKNYAVAEAGWTTVYLDPNGFMDLFVKDSPVNQMNWSHPEFEAALGEAARTLDPAARLEHLQRAEAVLLEQAPSVPLCHLTRAYLLAPGVRGWSANLFDDHPYKFVSLEPAAGR